jgi:stringent starvation protein B
MTQVSTTEIPGSSTRPYLIRALHDWCTDNGFTPYLAVHVDRSVQVPMEYVKNNEIVLNVGFEATSGLKLGNDFIEFRARFGGMARDILVPVDHVVAIYARENGQGMAFPMPTGEGEAPVGDNTGPVTHSLAPATEGAPRGLRLAPAGAQSDDAAPEPPAHEDDGDSPETPPPAPTTPRPALKRIK